LNKIRHETRTLRAEVLVLQTKARHQINRNEDCSLASNQPWPCERECSGLIGERNRLGGTEPPGSVDERLKEDCRAANSACLKEASVRRERRSSGIQDRDTSGASGSARNGQLAAQPARRRQRWHTAILEAQACRTRRSPAANADTSEYSDLSGLTN